MRSTPWRPGDDPGEHLLLDEGNQRSSLTHGKEASKPGSDSTVVLTKPGLYKPRYHIRSPPVLLETAPPPSSQAYPSTLDERPHRRRLLRWQRHGRRRDARLLARRVGLPVAIKNGDWGCPRPPTRRAGLAVTVGDGDWAGRGHRRDARAAADDARPPPRSLVFRIPSSIASDSLPSFLFTDFDFILRCKDSSRSCFLVPLSACLFPCE
ncbi:hypothetical protein PAHAL_5G187800 [Panicum hallii]|uniref:Uncharacterized protein n=1 Tax=Panicum hallii TaxID=206008 RepID=A0A2T8IKG1_9POAL|nr:hypothetical protein PAHAL_5G187800 [Panicum hallii]